MRVSARRIEVGAGAEARDIAILARDGNTPGLFWLGGFRSDMTGSKAEALDQLGAEHGLAVTRFDYSGHGRSGGDFHRGTISRWLEEALAVLSTTTGPQVVIGSSMGGWLALLLARHLRLLGTQQLAGLVLIAPATDMTEDLMLNAMTGDERAALERDGVVLQRSQYASEPYPITRALIEDGRQHLLFGRSIEVGCPVAILQGGQDPDVPQAHTLRLVEHMLHDEVSLTLVPDGDHRLSRPEDIELLRRVVLQLIEDRSAAFAH